MFYRQRGNRIQCLRTISSKVSGKQSQALLFSFVNTVKGFEDFTDWDLRKMTENEKDELRLYFCREEKMIETLIDDIHNVAIFILRTSYKTELRNINRLKASIEILNKNLRKVGL